MAVIAGAGRLPALRQAGGRDASERHSFVEKGWRELGAWCVVGCCLLQIPFWAWRGGSDTHWHLRDSPATVFFSPIWTGRTVRGMDEGTFCLPPESAPLTYSVSLFLNDTFHWCRDSRHNCQPANSTLLSVCESPFPLENFNSSAVRGKLGEANVWATYLGIFSFSFGPATYYLWAHGHVTQLLSDTVFSPVKWGSL